MDKANYLPTARTIQRGFGGLELLRRQLGFPIVHFGKGQNRSDIATLANKRGQTAENIMKIVLQAQFGEMFVHLEKPFSTNSKQRLDFYVFSPSGNFGVDVFHPQDLDSMIRSINIKQTTYKGYGGDLYLIVANNLILQRDIDLLLIKKKNRLPVNYKVMTIELLKPHIATMQRYKAITSGE